MLLALLFVTLPFVVRSVQPVLIELDARRRGGRQLARAPAASPSSAASCCPACCRPSSRGAGLAFARAIGEFGSVVLIAGNIPFKTQVASVHIFGLRSRATTPAGAAAVSVVLLLISFARAAGADARPALGRRADELD